MSQSEFTEETTVAADVDIESRYLAKLSAAWNAPILPQGGLTAAIVARAMQEYLDDVSQPLRSLSTVFTARVPPGDVTVDVSVLRRGRSMSQLAATLCNADGTLGLTATGIFGATRPGFAFTDATVPPCVPPERCPSFRDAPADAEGIIPASLWDRVEGRLVRGHSPWVEHALTTSEQIYWYRFDQTPTLASGALDPLALVVLGDTMLGSVAERMGTGLPRWLAPSADLTVTWFAEARGPWILARNRARHAGQGYVTLENELWDGDRLVALATQLAFFSFPGKDQPSA
ncbi:hypothetical protein JOF56_008539 [Kibdelosporangium banguiense]|uniref:Acyl-CoA thioesterase n=1 Tax=Kibdelosporangium banguiense TaxID=1365924 RepID=A0ABS4TUS9_9PSEU|nr:thioesterase family protein [Kibdelosporangium banguiense]MBP2328154.1 hypothetical protein [Kibdelosporangium banguiense]